MKILHVINYYHKGLGYQENCLPKIQQELGHEVIVITSDIYSPYLQTINNGTDRTVGTGTFFDNNVKIIRKKSYLKSVKRSGTIFFYIGEILNEYKPDIVHVHGATNMVIPEVCLRQKSLKYKIFIDSHQDSSSVNYTNSLSENIFYGCWRFFYHTLSFKNNISQFLPITGNASHWLEDRLQIPLSHMSISPLGVDLEIMAYDKDVEMKFRADHDIGEKIIIVNAGKQYPEKRIDWIIDVAIAARKSGIDILLVLVGNAEPEYETYINEKLEHLGPDCLRFPFLDRKELRKVYSAADIGIWPGFASNTIQEAMACKVALLLPDDDIVGHLIDGNGLTEAHDVNAAVSYIHFLASDKELLEKHKSRSENIAFQYSWQTIANKLLDLYEQKGSL